MPLQGYLLAARFFILLLLGKEAICDTIVEVLFLGTVVSASRESADI